MNLEQLSQAQSLPCTKCEGTGIRRSGRPCPYCDGANNFIRPDITSIVKEIKGRKGLRSKRPNDSRAYYVWRWARFNGGVDVTMPMMANLEAAGDPYLPLLDVVADKVAERVYGTSRAGASRWAGAMGYNVAPDPNLPPSAMPGGPVVMDGNKPLWEQLELV